MLKQNHHAHLETAVIISAINSLRGQIPSPLGWLSEEKKVFFVFLQPPPAALKVHLPRLPVYLCQNELEAFCLNLWQQLT